MIVRSAEKAGVENAVESEPAQRGRHRAGHVRARLEAEFLAQRDGDGRGVLDDDEPFRGRSARRAPA